MSKEISHCKHETLTRRVVSNLAQFKGEVEYWACPGCGAVLKAMNNGEDITETFLNTPLSGDAKFNFMRKVFLLLLIVPFVAKSQCTEIISNPYANSIAFKSEIEQVSGLIFPDSTIQGEHEIITYEGTTAKYKIRTEGDQVKSITIVAPEDVIQKLVNYFQEKNKDCRVNHGYQWALYKNCKLAWKKVSQSKSELFISKDDYQFKN